MQTVSCPSCGAPVEFRSHASVMAVCAYCRAAVIKDADSVKDLGKISAVLEDFSPIQIGTAGIHGGRGFTVVGRIQLRYDQGMWNEWYLLFDDGSAAWLGDSSGLFTITTVRETAPPLPDFHELVPGQSYQIGADHYTASEKREAECIGGEGELPFRVGDGWAIRVVDFRSASLFLTLDYTDGAIPVVYSGQAVLLPELRCQLLRDEEQIKTGTGRYRARVEALDCPSCGSAIKYVPGLTANLVCPACATQLDASGPEATVLAAGEALDKVANTLALGASANIAGSTHTVIGAMLRTDEEGTEWTEYLLFSPRAGFFWLVETDEGWFRATVLPAWPAPAAPAARSVRVDNQAYTKLYDYTATVRHAAGAFNWRVAAGDRVQVSEFESGQTTLAAELTEHELTWSRSTPVAYDQIKTWFRIDVTGDTPPDVKSPSSLVGSQMKFVWWILGLNAIPILFAFGETFFMTIVALVALFYPASYFQDGD
ncbi:MAG TPA: DUF4178 domain-containing protein [Telluria sp.]|jgi:hypothetical protein